GPLGGGGVFGAGAPPPSGGGAAGGLAPRARPLPVCYAQPRNLAARSELLAGAHLAGASLASAAMALHHGLCHVLGGTAGVPHGLANSIMLPHALRFNADALVPPPPWQAWGQVAAAALGLPETSDPVAAANAVADWAMQLIARLGLPQHLREVGVNEADLPR